MEHNDSLLHNMVRVQRSSREMHKACTRGRDETRITKSKWCSENHRSSAAGCHPRYMLPNTHHGVRKVLRLINVRGRVSILGWCGRCWCLVLLELVYLGLKVIDYVVSICEHYSMVLHLLLKLLQLLLHALDLQVLHGLKLLKLMGLNLGGLLSRP
jgi:hypothetical protein